LQASALIRSTVIGPPAVLLLFLGTAGVTAVIEAFIKEKQFVPR